MALSAKAWNYINTKPKRFNILHGSVRSSKTTNAMLTLPKRTLKAPHGDIVITGKTERTAYRNIIRPLQEMYGTKRIKYLKGMGEGKIGNRDFYVLGGNNEAAVTKAQGLTVAYWHADEAVTYPQAFTDMMVTRLSPTGACADLTMNPGGPYHPLKTDFIDNEELQRSGELTAWHFTLDDNPNLSESYIRSLKALYPASSLFYKRYILGLWVYAEGAIYDFFDETKHRLEHDITQDHPPDYYTLAGDYGIGNATSIGLYAHWNKPAFRNVKALRLRGYYYSGRETGRQKTDADYANDVASTFGDVKESHRRFFLDPSASSFKVLLRREGWKVRDAVNDVLDGIRTQSRMLQSGEYVIGPDASNDPCVKGYSAYLWDVKAQQRGEDKPLKKDDDTKDEERYELHTLYGGPDTIQPTRRSRRVEHSR